MRFRAANQHHSASDARGIMTSVSAEIVGGATSTITTTVATTAEVCK